MIVSIKLHYPADAPTAISTTPGGNQLETIRPTFEIRLTWTSAEAALVRANRFTDDIQTETQFYGWVVDRNVSYAFYPTPAEQDELKLHTPDEAAAWFSNAANAVLTRYRK